MTMLKNNNNGFSLVESSIGLALLSFLVAASMNLVTLNARILKTYELNYPVEDIALNRVVEIQHADYHDIALSPTDDSAPVSYPHEEFARVDARGNEDSDGMFLRSTYVRDNPNIEFPSKIVRVSVVSATVSPSGVLREPDPNSRPYVVEIYKSPNVALQGRGLL